MTPEQPITLRQRLRALATLLGIGLMCVGLVMFMLARVGRPHESGRRVICCSNLRQLSRLLSEYTNDYGAAPPDLVTLWKARGSEEVPLILVCPSTDHAAATDPWESDADARRNEHLSYHYFPPPHSRPIREDWPVVIDIPGNHGRDGVNVLFIRGYLRGFSWHVEFVPRREVRPVLKSLQEAGIALPGDVLRWAE